MSQVSNHGFAALAPKPNADRLQRLPRPVPTGPAAHLVQARCPTRSPTGSGVEGGPHRDPPFPSYRNFTVAESHQRHRPREFTTLAQPDGPAFLLLAVATTPSARRAYQWVLAVVAGWGKSRPEDQPIAHRDHGRSALSEDDTAGARKSRRGVPEKNTARLTNPVGAGRRIPVVR